MNEEADFVDLNNQENQFSRRRKMPLNRVIKKSQKQITGTLHLSPPEEDMDDGVEFFQPIYEGELIVGVIHKCSCGKTSELRFQYTDQ